MTKGSKVVGYVRVSTGAQGDNGLSLQAQREEIERECSYRGWELVAIEEDVSSGKTTKRRPGLERALAGCRSGETAGLVCSKIDRLSRSVIDFAKLLEDARRRGYNVVVLDLGVDLSTPNGELVANVLANVAQWEARIIGERTRTALAVAKKRSPAELRRLGKQPVGRPRTLPGDVRRRIVAERNRGDSLAEITRRLNEESVPTGQGGKCWYPSTVRTVAASRTLQR